MPYVYSTLTNDNVYTKYAEAVNDLPQIERKVLIKGGSNVATKQLVTPIGVSTEITAEELAICENDPVFQLHKKNGHITVLNKSTNPEKVAADMDSRDKSAPLREQDFDGSEGARLFTGVPKAKVTH